MHVKDALSIETEDQVVCPDCEATACIVVDESVTQCSCTGGLNWVELECGKCGTHWIVDYHLSDCKNKRTGE